MDWASLANAESSMIVLLIMVGFVTVAVGVPLYKLKVSSEETRLKQWSEREGKILQVVQQNSESNLKVAEAVAGIKTLIETNQRQCTSCMSQQLDRFDSLEEKHDELHLEMSKLTTILGERCEINVEQLDTEGANGQVGNKTSTTRPKRLPVCGEGATVPGH